MLNKLAFQELVESMGQPWNPLELLCVFDILETKILKIDIKSVLGDYLIVEEGVFGSEPLSRKLKLHKFLTLLVLIF